jgi:WD40 repeat protein
VALLLMTVASLAAHGCDAKSPVSLPSTSNQAAAGGPGAEQAVPAEAPSASAPSTADAPHPDIASQSPTAPAEGANFRGRTATPPAAIPSAEQLATWGILPYEPLRLLAYHDEFDDPAVQCLVISPDGKQFVLGGAKLTVWNVQESQPSFDLLANYRGKKVERPVSAVAISADRKWLAAGDQKGTLRIWDLSDRRELVSVRAHDADLSQLAFSPDSRYLATTSYSGEVRLWQPPECAAYKSLKMDEQKIIGLAFLSDTLLASAGSDVNIWNVAGAVKTTSLTSKHVISPAFGLSSDRRVLAFNDPDGAVQLWDVQNSASTGVTLQRAAARLLVFSDDRKWIATYSHDSTIRIWDATTGRVVQVIDADGGRTSALEWLPGSNSLLVASEQGRISIWGNPDAAQTLGIRAIELPAVEPASTTAKNSLTFPQLQQIIDLRSFPQLPGAIAQRGDFGVCTYTTPASRTEAELFYRYYLGKAGWSEAPSAGTWGGLAFHKSGCELGVTLAPAEKGPSGSDENLRVSLHFTGNYDARWLPKFAAIDSKSSWDWFSSVSYRTKAELTDVEAALLKQFHDAGWTAYTRLDASSHEDPNSRDISMLQGGSVLTVSIGYPADSTQELFVRTNVHVSNKSLPIPPDAGWIEFDSSTNLQLVANTNMDLQQTVQFFDSQMAQECWLARESGRQIEDDQGWLPYIRGQQEVLLHLAKLDGGGTRIVVGEAPRFSWQLKEPPAISEKSDRPGIEAADWALPAGVTAVKFDVDEKQIEFEVSGATPPELGEQFVTQMQALEWNRDGAGLISDEFVLISFKKEKAEIQLRARTDGKKAKAAISGDGLLWTKPLPTPPVRISYETWLRRNRKNATLDHLDEFVAEMHKIPVLREKVER